MLLLATHKKKKKKKESAQGDQHLREERTACAVQTRWPSKSRSAGWQSRPPTWKRCHPSGQNWAKGRDEPLLALKSYQAKVKQARQVRGRVKEALLRVV